MKQPILRKTAHKGGYMTPDGRFQVERIYPACFGWTILEDGEIIATAKTLAEARKLIGPEK